MLLSILLGFIGPWQVVLIVAIVLLLFGGKKIPELMKGLGKGMKEFKELEESHNVARLMDLIEGLVYNSGRGEYQYWTMATNLRKVGDIRQGDRESLESFAVRFTATGGVALKARMRIG